MVSMRSKTLVDNTIPYVCLWFLSLTPRPGWLVLIIIHHENSMWIYRAEKTKKKQTNLPPGEKMTVPINDEPKFFFFSSLSNEECSGSDHARITAALAIIGPERMTKEFLLTSSWLINDGPKNVIYFYCCSYSVLNF